MTRALVSGVAVQMALVCLAARRWCPSRVAAALAAMRFHAAAVLIDRAADRLPADATDVDIRFAPWLGLPHLTGRTRDEDHR